jgi:hypothetical protein
MTTAYWCRLVLRNAGGLIILFEVWTHSHWSVALSISMLYVSEELRSIVEELKKKLSQQSKKI